MIQSAFRHVAKRVRRSLGADMLAERMAAQEARLTEMTAALAALAAKPPPPPVVTGTYALLPASEHARHALPVDYPPSRDLRPRWGNTHPPIAPIAGWMQRYEADYGTVLSAIRERTPQLRTIARDFDWSMLPEPGWCGVPYAAIDSAALYTIIGEHKPERYLEIGSGITTAFARRSVKDHGLRTRITSIDPQPRGAIDSLCDEVVRDGLETVDIAIFDTLRAGDILFLDGSHRSFMNSDVTVFMIDVLPRLRPGVLIHVHDIMLPWDYPDMFTHWYWSEAYILAAYLLGGLDRVRPIFPSTWVCRGKPFAEWFAAPPVDLGSANGDWLGGGALWFTHIRQA